MYILQFNYKYLAEGVVHLNGGFPNKLKYMYIGEKVAIWKYLQYFFF